VQLCVSPYDGAVKSSQPQLIHLVLIVSRFTFPDCEADVYDKVWDLFGFYEGPDQFINSLANSYGTVYPPGLAHQVQLDGDTVELQCLNLVRAPSPCSF
jgi:hypothetical protein